MGADFVELRAWQEAAAVAADVLRLAGRMGGPGSRALADQLVRAAQSVPANIAEGFGRGLSDDGARFLVIARASAAELESHLRIAAQGGIIASDVVHGLVIRIRFARLLTHRLHGFVARRARRRRALPTPSPPHPLPTSPASCLTCSAPSAPRRPRLPSSPA